MSFEIPIVNPDGIAVCTVVWDGDLYVGVFSIIPITGNEAVARNLSNMILTRSDLRDVKYRSDGDKFTVNGWKSYEGVIGALRTVLPSLGLQIGHIGGDKPSLGNERASEIAFNEQHGGIE